ncbi:cytochrome b [Paroceanicella profunda]|uniref:Cytochrome b n=1 Tax=Paroceanicella profunda TaxID=2579971 RepID=A0A5B8FHY9_9RHOB|nr:cytochrome b [Paroceanicella profunda]QDL93031.1 cytochrome b [Paroceanicella profunda]
MADGIHYHGLQRLLHWTIALLVIFMVPAGLVISDFSNKQAVEVVLGPAGFDTLYALHKSTGFAILALMILRIASRLAWRAPPYYPPLTRFEHIASSSVHGILYLLLLVVPVLGWLGVSAYPAPLPVYGLFEMPAISAPDQPFAERVLGVHGVLGISIGVLAAIHIVAALYHGLLKRDGVLGRMIG